MLNLAIECSGISGSVALFRHNRSIDFQVLPAGGSSVQSLASTIDRILKSNAKETLKGQLTPDFISITQGPGSFTGLRVGLATAKMLAMAWNIPIAGVDSLAAVALQTSQAAPPDNAPRIVVAVMNAFRKQVFAGAWGYSGDMLTKIADSQVVDAGPWAIAPLMCLKTHSHTSEPLSNAKILVSGPGLIKYPLSQSAEVTIAEQTCWHPQAGAVAQLGWEEFQRGTAVSANELQANYVRASAAEEKQQPR